MKTKIISYSFTGNNAQLAQKIAEKISAEHIVVQEKNKRSVFKIALDVIFNRTPKIAPLTCDIDHDDLIIFMGPVWMGSVASPLRACFSQLQDSMGRYAYISISSGADGSNPKITDDLTKRIGKAPVAVIDLHIADLMSQDSQPTREDISQYKITDEDIEKLAQQAISQLREKVSDF
jgi:multimeric flavodoxin WrbA